MLRLVSILVAPLIEAAELIDRDRWCFNCHDEVTDSCLEGKCFDVVDHGYADVPVNEPDVDWGGGD